MNMNTHYGTWECFWTNRKRITKKNKAHNRKRTKIAKESKKRNRK